MCPLQIPGLPKAWDRPGSGRGLGSGPGSRRCSRGVADRSDRSVSLGHTLSRAHGSAWKRSPRGTPRQAGERRSPATSSGRPKTLGSVRKSPVKPRALRASSCPQRQAVAWSTLSTAPGTRARRYTETLRSACQALGTGDCRERWLGTQRSCLRGARVLATPRAAQPGPHRAPHLLAAGPAARHPQPPRACDRARSGQRLNVTLYRHFAGDRAAPTCPPRLASRSRSPGESCGQPRVVRRGGNSGRVASSPAGLQTSSSPSPPFRVPSLWVLAKTAAGGGGERGNRCLGRMEAILEEEPRPCPPPWAGDTGGTSFTPGPAQDRAPPAPAASSRLASAGCEPGAGAAVVPMARS